MVHKLVALLVSLVVLTAAACSSSEEGGDQAATPTDAPGDGGDDPGESDDDDPDDDRDDDRDDESAGSGDDESGDDESGDSDDDRDDTGESGFGSGLLGGSFGGDDTSTELTDAERTCILATVPELEDLVEQFDAGVDVPDASPEDVRAVIYAYADCMSPESMAAGSAGLSEELGVPLDPQAAPCVLRGFAADDGILAALIADDGGFDTPPIAAAGIRVMIDCAGPEAALDIWTAMFSEDLDPEEAACFAEAMVADPTLFEQFLTYSLIAEESDDLSDMPPAVLDLILRCAA